MTHKLIPYGRQHITDEDIQAVADVLRSDYLTQGPKVAEFETAFADYIGCRFSVAVSSGTAALHLCTLSLGVKNGQKVITTPITFAASANCVLYAGGDVIFADIDPETYLLDIKKVKELLGKSPKGTYTGIIPVDFSGRPVDLEIFRKIADEYSLWILEDACHAPGGFFIDSKGNNHRCGDASNADLAIFSFHPVKHIATGEGGMITTNDEELYKKLIMLRTHGIIKETGLFQNSTEFANGDIISDQNNNKQHKTYPGWYYEMQELGFNYRLTDFQAALGISQLKRANEALERRKGIALKYDQAFKGKHFIKGQSGYINGHGYHLYIIEVTNRGGLYSYLRKFNIFAQIHYIPVHLQPYYRQFGWKEGDLPHAENYYRNCISLPMFPSLTDEDQHFVIDKINSYYES
jgi:hypothetical protein